MHAFANMPPLSVFLVVYLAAFVATCGIGTAAILLLAFYNLVTTFFRSAGLVVIALACIMAALLLAGCGTYNSAPTDAKRAPRADSPDWRMLCDAMLGKAYKAVPVRFTADAVTLVPMPSGDEYCAASVRQAVTKLREAVPPAQTELPK